MNLGTVRQAMAAAMDAAVTGVQVNPYALGQPTPPGIQILSGGVEYDRAFSRGLDEWTFTVQAFVALNADQAPQKLLDTLCAPTGAGSIKAALESDRTLGGAVQTLRVLSQSPARQATRPDGSSMLLVEFQVQIMGN